MVNPRDLRTSSTIAQKHENTKHTPSSVSHRPVVEFQKSRARAPTESRMRARTCAVLPVESDDEDVGDA